MGRQKGITCLFIALTLLTWGPPRGTAAQENPQPTVNTQDNVEHWLTELASRVPDAGEKPAAGPARKRAAQAKEPVPNASAEHPAQAASASTEEERISVDFFRVDLHNVFRLLGQVSGKNIVVDEAVHGTLTLALQDVPWTFVLEVIKSLKDLSSIERHNTIMIYPSDKKVAWAGEGEATGTLDLGLRVSDVQKTTSKLSVESRKESLTPVGNIVKAEQLVKDARAAELEGNHAAALERYKDAADLWPDNAALAKKVAFLALGQDEDEITALNYAKKALRAAPRDSEASTLAAVTLARMEKNDEARIYFERAMTGETIPFQTLYNYAVFCFSREMYRDTLRLVNRIEAEHPLSADIMMLKAQAYEHTDNRAQAMNEYRAIINSGHGVPSDTLQYAQARLRILMEEGQIR